MFFISQHEPWIVSRFQVVPPLKFAGLQVCEFFDRLQGLSAVTVEMIQRGTRHQL